MSIATINPATGRVLKTFESQTEDQVRGSLERSGTAFRSYRNTSFEDRTRWMMNAARILEDEQQRFGEIMTLEMGKPIRSAREESIKCAWACRYYAEQARGFLADEVIETTAKRSYVSFQPLGTILAIMPWNFPFWQVFRFAAPALMAGNVGLLKHASNVPQCALLIEDIFRRSGFPDGVFQTLLIGSAMIDPVIESDVVKAVTLTGSEPAGRSVASLAGRNIKKTVLELGGSDPFIVMPSADIELAARTAVRARTINNGQSCIAAKRFIVHEEIAEAFEALFIEGMKALKVGDPMQEAIDIGPLATADIRETLHQQVQQSVAMGARLLLGGTFLAGPGNFYLPTILDRIPKGSPAYADELFGPVASLFRVRSAGEAVELANDTPFGLAASVWTNDPQERELFVEGIEAGAVFFNGMVASDPRLPFGGVKHSGYGRELSVHGIREFVNAKTIWIGS